MTPQLFRGVRNGSIAGNWAIAKSSTDSIDARDIAVIALSLGTLQDEVIGSYRMRRFRI